MRTLPIVLALIAAAPAAAQQIAANTGRVYELYEVEVLPRPQNLPEFRAALAQAYPPHLREAGVGGTVHVGFVLGPDGVPTDVRVLSTPDSSFTAPSVQALSLLRFTPAQVGGRPVAVRVEQPITWRAEAPFPAAAAESAGARAAADTADGYELFEVEVLPRPINRREFTIALARSYPVPLRDRGQDGQVVVRFRVELDGSISNATIVSTTHPAFSEPTLRALPVLRFRPGRVAGRPVRTWVQLPINWTVARDGPTLEGIEEFVRPGRSIVPRRPGEVYPPTATPPAPCRSGRPC